MTFLSKISSTEKLHIWILKKPTNLCTPGSTIKIQRIRTMGKWKIWLRPICWLSKTMRLIHRPTIILGKLRLLLKLSRRAAKMLRSIFLKKISLMENREISKILLNSLWPMIMERQINSFAIPCTNYKGPKALQREENSPAMSYICY